MTESIGNNPPRTVVRPDANETSNAAGTFEPDAFGSNQYNSEDRPLDPNSARLVAGGIILSALAVAGTQAGFFGEVGSSVVDAKNHVVDMGENIGHGIAVPFDKSIDVLGKIIPDDEPKKQRIPYEIIKGKVEIKADDALNARTSPSIHGKEMAGNAKRWEDVELANVKIEGGKITYEAVDFKPGDTLIIENPELVSGQYTGGGNGAGKEKPWLQLYTTSGEPIYVNFQSETDPYVEVIEDLGRIKAKTLQDSHGIRLIQYSETLPEQINHITVKPRE